MAFGTGKQKYETDIKLGKKYRDAQTGIEGTAVSITFWQHSCERVGIECVIDKKIEDYVFDSPRLVEVETGVQATTERRGGPGLSATGKDPAARR